MRATTVKGLVKYAIGFGLLAYVLASNWHSDDPSTPGLAELLRNPVQFVPLLAAAVLCAASVLLTFVRWYLLVRAQDLPFTLRGAVRLGLVGYFFNTFLPGAVGGDILKAYAISKQQSRRTVAVATVLIDRAIGLWGLVWFVGLLGFYLHAAGHPALGSHPELRTIVRTAWWVLAATLGVWVALGFLPQWRAERFSRRLRSLPKVGHSLGEFWLAVWIYRNKPGAVFGALLMSLVSHTGFVLTFHFATRIFAAGQPEADLGTFAEHFLIVPVGMIVQAFFPSPGGVGGGEAAFGWLYAAVLHKPRVTGVVGCLAQRVITWGLGLIGYLVYLRMRERLPAGAAAAEEPAPPFPAVELPEPSRSPPA
ncbi:MAG TPA: lysylphosphatidylglycerol synthase transmembrane domain-containing protein [Gemmataceae bacterium]